MGVVPGHALVVGEVAGKGETYLFYPQYNITFLAWSLTIYK